MRTDIQTYRIFEAEPDWIFELTGLPSPGESTFQTVALKALERTADGVNIPVNINQPITVLEIQFQKDESIYTRLVAEMVLIQEAHAWREVQGIILFRDETLDPKTAPWTKIVHAYPLDNLLTEFEKTHPHHPLTAVFKPVFVEDTQSLAKNAAAYYRDISQSALDERTKSSLHEVLVSWLQQRFRDKGRKEIEAMLITELPNLEDTKSGKELIKIGEERGEKRGEERALRQAILAFLKARNASLPVDLQDQLAALELEKAQQLLSVVAQTQDLDTVKNWLADNASSIP